MPRLTTTLVLLAAGCPAAPPSPPTTTGIDPACPVAPLAYPSPCVETTAPMDATYTYGPVVAAGRGTVLEAGSELPDVPGSAPLGGYGACSPAQTHQVRLVDAAGETWTFGWDIEGAFDDDSLAEIEDGETLDFYATWIFFGYSSGGAVILSDDAGPLFLLELGYTTLDDDQRGFSITQADACTSDLEGWAREYHQLTLTWSDGTGDLWPGDTIVVPYGERSVDVVLGDASWLTSCADGCGAQWWAGVAESP